MGIPDFLKRLFVGKGKLLSWERIRDDHVLDANNDPLAPQAAFAAGNDYVVLRLAEMYLKTIRLLWREKYPVVHAFVSYGDAAAIKNVTTIAGPGQLKDLGTANLDRLIGLAYRLAGPIVYDGHDIELLAGLYAAPARDGAKILLDTLSQLSGIVPVLGEAGKVSGVLTAGVAGLLGLDNTDLVLGIHDTLKPAPIPGFVVAINAPDGTLNPAELWVRGGRLYYGETPLVALPYDDHDMMLFELDRGPSRAMAWATLPALASHSATFDVLLRQTAAVSELRTKLAEAYRSFELDVSRSSDLTETDKGAIRSIVSTDLRTRVDAIEKGVLFGETRSVMKGAPLVEYRSFNPRDLPEPPPGALPDRPEGLTLF